MNLPPSTPLPLSAPLQSEHVSLVYRWRPALPSAARRPLLILLHGVGGDESSMAPLIERLPADVHVALVRGPLAMAQGGYGWYSLQETAMGLRADPDQAEAARLLLLQFIAQLRQAHPFDPRQVYVAGFSQGGVLSASVGLTRPDKVAGIAILCGRILSQVKWQLAPDAQLSHLQAFLAHGGADEVIPSEHAVDAMHTLAEHRVQLVYRDYPGGHEISNAMAADFAHWVAQRATLAYERPG
ncbi:dienelactone hydrolase family protein [Aquabacterium sp. A7-Y]|uniref:alpha/beta hydrolase n=1 Tax=Aquabacterium sp. A7-Y TaxID=1349605 RepID=UPI00223D0720|nr:PHB depolymerase family esterase [Aquabacterium sp. A7-Y]MCW7539213.1 dienelactone hydrolase family protein [Aquabacterium sp. A7-Y]